MKNKRKLQEQFEDRYIPVPEAGCWLWDDENRPSGRPASRTAWLLRHGAKPAGKRILHACGNEACVNPEHLRIVD